MSHKGWIKIHRQIIDSDIYQMPPLYLRTFERLIIEANHQDKEIPFKYSGDSVTSKKLIKRGERQTSIRQICEWVGWYEYGIFKKPNPKTIREILDWLIVNGMIEIYPKQSNREGTHYKIVNYNDYQSKEDEEVTVTGAISNSKVTVTGSKQECKRMNKNDKEDISMLQQSSNEDKPIKPEYEFGEDSTEIALARFMINEMLRVKPDSKVPKSDVKSLQNWAKHIDYMIRLDKREPRQIAELFRWVQNDTFWVANIRSPQKLRKQWDALELRRAGEKKPKQNKNLSNLEQMYQEAVEEEGGLND